MYASRTGDGVYPFRTQSPVAVVTDLCSLAWQSHVHVQVDGKTFEQLEAEKRAAEEARHRKEQRSVEERRAQKVAKAAEERAKWWDFARAQFGSNDGEDKSTTAAEHAATLRGKTGKAPLKCRNACLLNPVL